MSFNSTYRYKTDFKRFDEVKLLSEGVKTSVIEYNGALYKVPTTALAMDKPKESPVINKSLIPGDDSITQIQFAITKSNRPLWFTRTTGNRFEWTDYFFDYRGTETA